MVISFTFQVYWMKIHSKLNKFGTKNTIVSDLRFLLEIQAILPETSPFLCVQMAVQLFSQFMGPFIKIEKTGLGKRTFLSFSWIHMCGVAMTRLWRPLINA
jgi:hypothetical protein